MYDISNKGFQKLNRLCGVNKPTQSRPSSCHEFFLKDFSFFNFSFFVSKGRRSVQKRVTRGKLEPSHNEHHTHKRIIENQIIEKSIYGTSERMKLFRFAPKSRPQKRTKRKVFLMEKENHFPEDFPQLRHRTTPTNKQSQLGHRWSLLSSLSFDCDVTKVKISCSFSADFSYIFSVNSRKSLATRGSAQQIKSQSTSIHITKLSLMFSKNSSRNKFSEIFFLRTRPMKILIATEADVKSARAKKLLVIMKRNTRSFLHLGAGHASCKMPKVKRIPSLLIKSRFSFDFVNVSPFHVFKSLQQQRRTKRFESLRMRSFQQKFFISLLDTLSKAVADFPIALEGM